jgi:DNA-binding helix-hairpin-helix protein with protein kinase domain
MSDKAANEQMTAQAETFVRKLHADFNKADKKAKQDFLKKSQAAPAMTPVKSAKKATRPVGVCA